MDKVKTQVLIKWKDKEIYLERYGVPISPELGMGKNATAKFTVTYHNSVEWVAAYEMNLSFVRDFHPNLVYLLNEQPGQLPCLRQRLDDAINLVMPPIISKIGQKKDNRRFNLFPVKDKQPLFIKENLYILDRIYNSRSAKDIVFTVLATGFESREDGLNIVGVFSEFIHNYYFRDHFPEIDRLRPEIQKEWSKQTELLQIDLLKKEVDYLLGNGWDTLSSLQYDDMFGGKE